MRLLHGLARTHASFDDPNLVSRAGLVPVMALAQGAGLADLVAAHVRPGGECGVNAPSRRILTGCFLRSLSRIWLGVFWPMHVAVRHRRSPWWIAGSPGLSGIALALRRYSLSSASSGTSACCRASGSIWASRSIRAAYSLLASRSVCWAAMRCAAWFTRDSSPSSLAALSSGVG